MKTLIIYKLFAYISEYIAYYLNAIPVEDYGIKGNKSDDKGLHKKKMIFDNNCRTSEVKNTKSTTTEDIDDNHNDYNHNNCRGNCNPSNPSYSYYCYDQRVYNIYKINENEKSAKSSGFLEAIKALNWKYVLIGLSLLTALVLGSCYLGADILSWLIFHKVFSYIFNNHLIVDRSDVPV